MCTNNDLLVKSSADLFQVYDFLFIKEGGKERRGLVTQLINMEGLNTMYKVGPMLLINIMVMSVIMYVHDCTTFLWIVIE